MIRFLSFSMMMVLLGSQLLMSCKQAEPTASAPAPAQPFDSTMQQAGGTPKIGYVKSLEILSLLPEIKAADKKLEGFARSKESTFRSLAEKYQTGMVELQERGMLLSQADQEKKIQELQALEGQLQQMQANSQSDLGQERERLYAPIMAKVDSIIKIFGKEEGFAMIYDGSALVYGDSLYDVTPLVKIRLGITEEETEEKK